MNKLTTNDTSKPITWEQLTEGEQNALSRWINIDREFVNEFEKGLQAKGLIRIVRIDHHRHQNMLTDAGRAVLAQAASGQPEAVNRGKPSSLFFDETELIDDSMPSTQPEAEGEDDDIDMRTMSDDDLQRTIDQLPAIRAQYAMEEELATLRAQLAASLEREAALREALKPFMAINSDYVDHCENAKYDGNLHMFVGEFYSESFLVKTITDICEALAASDGAEGSAE